jgi:hypothetical protein
MAVEHIHFDLRGWGGAEPMGTRFFELIGFNANTGFTAYPSDSLWRAARIVLFGLEISECEPGTERYQEFSRRIEAGLQHAARWLASLTASAFDEWRGLGKKADVFIGGWMNNDQFDLTLPPQFLAECGRLGLPITICTND